MSVFVLCDDTFLVCGWPCWGGYLLELQSYNSIFVNSPRVIPWQGSLPHKMRSTYASTATSNRLLTCVLDITVHCSHRRLSFQNTNQVNKNVTFHKTTKKKYIANMTDHLDSGFIGLERALMVNTKTLDRYDTILGSRPTTSWLVTLWFPKDVSLILPFALAWNPRTKKYQVDKRIEWGSKKDEGW